MQQAGETHAAWASTQPLAKAKESLLDRFLAASHPLAQARYDLSISWLTYRRLSSVQNSSEQLVVLVTCRSVYCPPPKMSTAYTYQGDCCCS